MFTARTILAVVVAGIAGTIANSIVVGLAVDTAILPLVFSFGREAVAIIVALLLPVIFASMTGAARWATAIVALAVIPSILAKTVFGLGAGWGFVLAVNAVYAVVATLVYAAIVGAFGSAGRTP